MIMVHTRPHGLDPARVGFSKQVMASFIADTFLEFYTSSMRVLVAIYRYRCNVFFYLCTVLSQ